MKNISKVLSMVGCMAMLQCSTLQAEEMVSDSFDQSKESSALSGRKTETGNLEWEATENVVVQSEKKGGSLAFSDSEGFVARLPVADDFSIATVEAEVRPSSASGGDPWLAIGFGGGSINPGSINVNWPRGIFLLVTAKGRYQCVINPSKSGGANLVQVLGGDVDGFSPDDFVPLRLEYNKEQNKVNMWVNGRLVLKDYHLEENGFTPDMSHAGISGYGQIRDHSGADNFAISVQ